MRETDPKLLADCRIDQNYLFMSLSNTFAQSYSILKGDMFMWEITRCLWCDKYCSSYILADLLPHIVMTLFQSTSLEHIDVVYLGLFFPFSFLSISESISLLLFHLPPPSY